MKLFGADTKQAEFGSELSAEVMADFFIMGRLPDGRICAIHQLIHHWTLLVDVNNIGYEDRYCYRDSLIEVVAAALKWEGDGDPEGWVRHPTTGRRWNPETDERWVAL